MRRVLLRRTVAAVAAVVVTLPLGARPVQAFDFTAIIGAAKAAYELYKEYKEGQSLDDATDKIIKTINDARTDILAQVDRLATAQAKACARSAIIDFNDIPNFNQTTLQAYARDTTACVTLIDSLLDVVTDKASADQLGFTLNTVGPLALTARAHAGFSTSSLLDQVVDSNNTVLSTLKPTCSTAIKGLNGIPQNGAVYTWETRCTAYDGKVGSTSKRIAYPPTTNPYDVPGTTAIVMRHTSHAQATAVLPVLRATPA
ncbi:hypothetical protein O7623_07945 [Solwaraspora sp. WMMD791]|uniref:hypothetical protein n=1 Tax=Solwaraspora sp. WMMD791 TaxID=3016086 RepID=UPI00249AA5F1|nr:hypothetical protein [Solwaraspora sp. WMMD791]WFE29105.1 hypothetical protein O7623_07945 [Solwaraspora sp. WMMD791]